jgi:GMP synthase (glutamine-hydrolysing)
VTSHPLLVVEHEAQCPAGWMGEWLADAGCPVDLRRPYRGDSLPDHLDRHRGMLVLGGSMDAYSEQRHPWLDAVKQLVRVAATERAPVLGICLGLQLATVALGGAVRPNPRGQQIGLLDVGWTPEAAHDPLLGPVTGAGVALQWNNDIVTALPVGAVVLARTPAGEIQAARLAPTVWGVQSHPEAGAEILAAWAENDRDAAAERGVDVEAYVDRVAAARQQLRSAWQPLAVSFTALTGKVAGTW